MNFMGGKKNSAQGLIGKKISVPIDASVIKHLSRQECPELEDTLERNFT